MRYRIENEPAMKLIGFQMEMSDQDAFVTPPKFWDEILEKHFNFAKALGPIQYAIIQNNIGKFGVCYPSWIPGKSNYMIAGVYKGGEILPELTTVDYPECTFAKFTCVGPIPGSLQKGTQYIFQTWIKEHPEVIPGHAVFEHYLPGDQTSDTYISEIWLPVTIKN